MFSSKSTFANGIAIGSPATATVGLFMSAGTVHSSCVRLLLCQMLAGIYWRTQMGCGEAERGYRGLILASGSKN
jgi:hypothetical protein